MPIPKHRRSAHPGEILLEEFLKPMGLMPDQLACHLGWTTPKLNEIIEGKRAITLDDAIELAEACCTTDIFWMNLQENYDLGEN